MSWFCTECETENPDDVQLCEVCGFCKLDKEEELFWANTLADNTVKMYEEYILRYPSGRYVAKAKSRIRYRNAKDLKCWLETEKAGTPDSYLRYKNLYPDGKYIGLATQKLEEFLKVDNNAWQKACSIGTVESYTKYLQDFPSGVHAKDAKTRIETIYWNNAKEADTVESYQSYLTHFSYGAYTTRAKNRIKQIEEELKLWNYAEKENTISSYNLYLKKYPDGKHKDEANRRIKSLAERLKRRKRIRKAVVSILCCALLILSVFVGPSIVTYINQNFSAEAVKRSQVIQHVDVSALEKDTENIYIVRDLMNKGHYEEALTIIKGLNVVQNDRYSEDLAKIERIKNLYNNALSYYKKDYYSRAITNYEEIIKIYNSLSFYVDKSFINSKIRYSGARSASNSSLKRSKRCSLTYKK